MKIDWRRMGQEKFLLNKKLKYKKYDGDISKGAHEHCSFCYELISSKGPITEAYCTLDEENWICKKCYDDFKDEFHWIIIEGE